MAKETIRSYKTDLLKDIINCDVIVNGIDSQSPNYIKDEPDSLIYNNLFPFMKVVGTQTVADTYILLAVDIMNVNKYNPTYATYRIKLRILAHEDRMKMKGQSGTRLDYLFDELKHLLDGQMKYGFSELVFDTRVEDIFNEKYNYVDMIFYTNDLRKQVDRR